jgi:hypothetical protein
MDVRFTATGAPLATYEFFDESTCLMVNVK